jgi:hypothetical protein
MQIINRSLFVFTLQTGISQVTRHLFPIQTGISQENPAYIAKYAKSLLNYSTIGAHTVPYGGATAGIPESRESLASYQCGTGATSKIVGDLLRMGDADLLC